MRHAQQRRRTAENAIDNLQGVLRIKAAELLIEHDGPAIPAKVIGTNQKYSFIASCRMRGSPAFVSWPKLEALRLSEIPLVEIPGIPVPVAGAMKLVWFRML